MNRWNSPCDVHGLALKDDGHATVKLMKSDSFWMIFAPSKERVQTPFFPLPSEFSTALRTRVTQIIALRSMVNNEELDPDVRKQLRMSIQVR